MATIITRENGQIECQNEMLRMNVKTGENEYTQLMPVESCEGIVFNNNNLVMANSRYKLPHIQLESLIVSEACNELENRVFKGGRIFTKMTGATTGIQTIINSTEACDIVFWRNKYYGLFVQRSTRLNYLLTSDDGKVFNERFGAWSGAIYHEMVVCDDKLWICGNIYGSINNTMYSVIWYIESTEDRIMHGDINVEQYPTTDTTLDYPCHIATDGTTLFATFKQYSDNKTKILCKSASSNSYTTMTIDTTSEETLHSRPCVLASALYISQFDTSNLCAFAIGSNGIMIKHTVNNQFANIKAISRCIDDNGAFFYIIQGGTDFIRKFTFTNTFVAWTETSDNGIQKYGNNFDMIFCAPMFIYNAFDNNTGEYRCYYGEKPMNNQLYVDCKPIVFKNSDYPIQELNMLHAYNDKVYGIGSKDNCFYYTIYE